MNGAGWQAAELILSASVIVATSVPVLRVAMQRPVRREFAAHPVFGAVAIAVALVVLASGLWLALESPGARRAMVAAMAVAGLIAWLHALPSYGRRRGLPPGSMGLRTSLKAVDDPSFYTRAAARHGPVFKMRQVHRPVACVTDLAVLGDLLEREDGSLGQSEWAFNRLVPGGYLEFMEGETHARYRQAFAPAFTAESLRSARTPIAATSRLQLAAMARAAGTHGAHPEPFLHEVPFVALLHTVLGVGTEHPRLPELRAGFAAITAPFEVHLPTPPPIAAGYLALVAVVRDLGPAAAASPVPSVLQSVVRQDDAHASDPTILGNLILMVKEGSIMVRGLLRWVLRALASDPSHTRAFRDAASNPMQLESLSIAFVRETLRLHEDRYFYRTARQAVRIGRFRVPKGWLIRICASEAHEDPRNFPDPQRFDPSRFQGPAPGPDKYCPFGAGSHTCFGEDLTLAIAGGFAREAALGWDLRVASDGPMWRINRHWGLWRPSPEFRLTLTPVHQ